MIQKSRRSEQCKQLKFLSIKVPKISAKNSGEIEVTDHVQDMKQNIQLMNQIYKNMYALYSSSFTAKMGGQDYIGIELYIEKESIKYIMAVPDYFVDTVEKMIPSFYPGAVVEITTAPQFLESGKYISGGEMSLSQPSEYPIKTYEAFEADPMDSLLSAYSKVELDEKLCLQILLSPTNTSVHK